jgi:hypothetical protein
MASLLCFTYFPAKRLKYSGFHFLAPIICESE